ncbi:MAG: hypothetical protein COV10_01110 [Candidatus Vogelbacteria bacterium CG10_big_fil_rev_8_21_14_0_10_51_16]|uniref:Uncharacterized protein n=1 Tax=Candidatus Vogelbacteria bacterium CG10_big_fil_rev_8_21_14_0_10_51_16 TaxID=1975045 RepID=A0A2H0RF75_9BACT|nr:MAG: hypothetical protein COV10_01110 [Candidatus Vogelbacteria bacterium CG10_big_fil_rev_8_21_14_0_10_51_16]
MKRATKKTNVEPTTQDVLNAVSKFATRVEERFDGIDARFDGIDGRLSGHDKRFESLEEDVAYLKRNMVTKIYLDERVGELRGDITELVHKEDKKFVELVHTLEDKEVLSEEDAVRILGMPPFGLGQAAH